MAARSGDLLAGVLGDFPSLTLAQLDEAALLSRFDDKFVVDGAVLPAVLAAATGCYRVLEVAGVRLSTYDSQYYDTPGLDLYLAHHHRRPRRLKVRRRHYIESRTSFFEIKKKTPDGRSTKTRAALPPLSDSWLQPGPVGLLHTETGMRICDIVPTVRTLYRRATLVNRNAAERATIDIELRFEAGDRAVELPGTVVVEIKRPRGTTPSPVLGALRRAGCRPLALSKYCVGVALLAPGVQRNAFRPILRRLPTRHLTERGA